ncbi:MAG: hypothetical protein AMS23_00895 [Bacteroides sp. SM1_62]|nr:MAG: hypothetical protein AMS23_00895 [Bacteroides sp. SM1_62]
MAVIRLRWPFFLSGEIRLAAWRVSHSGICSIVLNCPEKKKAASICSETAPFHILVTMKYYL